MNGSPFLYCPQHLGLSIIVLTEILHDLSEVAGMQMLFRHQVCKFRNLLAVGADIDNPIFQDKLPVFPVDELDSIVADCPIP